MRPTSVECHRNAFTMPRVAPSRPQKRLVYGVESGVVAAGLLVLLCNFRNRCWCALGAWFMGDSMGLRRDFLVTDRMEKREERKKWKTNEIRG
jgi:hypothetical protein